MSKHKPNKAHAHEERGEDLYESPTVAVNALLEIEWLPELIWEPACGPGAIVRPLRREGHTVIASDLVDYQCEGQEAGVDFLRLTSAPAGCTTIVSNPPYKIANDFVRRALVLCPRVIMLMRFAFLASGSKRNDILDGGCLARVHLFANRLPMMHRAGWQGKQTTSDTDFAWFVWDRSHYGPTLLNRVRWKPE